MSDVRWIKIVTDIFDDDKILLIESMPEADAIIVIWFKLLCLAGKQNNSGVFILNNRIAFTDEMFATIFRRPLNTVRLALQTFERFGMVELINDTYSIPNWGKYQTIDKIESRNDYMREYMKGYREKQKAIMGCKANDDVNSKPNVSVVEKNRKDKRREEKIREESIGADARRFTPPLVEDVTTYANEKGWSDREFSPSGFVDFYASKGWKIGKAQMKDWKAAARGWVSRYRQEHPQEAARVYKDADYENDW